MQKTLTNVRTGIHLCLMLLCIVVFAGICEAESLNVKDILKDTAKYSDRQVQVEGRVERWIELGRAEKMGLYLLKDNFGDEIKIKTMESMPQVGESVTVKGLVTFDNNKNEYYILSINNLTGNEPTNENAKHISNTRPLISTMLSSDFNTPRNLLFLLAIAIIVFLFIIFIAIRLKKGKKKVFDVPDFAFDETETIKIDVNGQFLGSGVNDESTVVFMPGHFRITKGPKELDGKLYRLTSVLTKIGREESGVNKSSGWITFPSTCLTISRHQADLVYKDGGYYVENKSTANVTKLNGAILNCNETYQLSDKDIISFSEIDLTYSGSM